MAGCMRTVRSSGAVLDCLHRLVSVKTGPERSPNPAFSGVGMPGLSSPRPAGRCLAVKAQAHRVRGRAGAWLVVLFRPSSLAGAGGLGC